MLSQRKREQLHELLMRGIDRENNPKAYEVLSDLVTSEIDEIEKIVESAELELVGVCV